jgi:hypothetical protein
MEDASSSACEVGPLGVGLRFLNNLQCLQDLLGGQVLYVQDDLQVACHAFKGHGRRGDRRDFEDSLGICVEGRINVGPYAVLMGLSSMRARPDDTHTAASASSAPAATASSASVYFTKVPLKMPRSARQWTSDGAPATLNATGTAKHAPQELLPLFALPLRTVAL